MKAPAYSATGTKKDAITLDNAVFGVTPNPQLLHLAYRKHLANQRTNNAATSTRGKVSGGGKKPWRQKGTGRARTGSIRNPLWRGGGVIFGPTGEENYQLSMPKKMARVALHQALSAQSENIRVIEKIALSEPKTKPALDLLAKLEAEGRILVVLDQAAEATVKSFRNIAGVSLVPVRQLSVFAILNADCIILERSAADYLITQAKGTKS